MEQHLKNGSLLTANECLKQQQSLSAYLAIKPEWWTKDIHKAMIEFAKLHVQAALKEQAMQAKVEIEERFKNTVSESAQKLNSRERLLLEIAVSFYKSSITNYDYSNIK